MESSPADTNDKLKHDKQHVMEVLHKLEVDPNAEMKIVRLGKRSDQARPLKVTFSHTQYVSQCLKQKNLVIVILLLGLTEH